MVQDSQLCDFHTRMEHAQPHCTSRQLYKGILDNTASGVFNGRIVVAPGAQKTDAIQSSRSLLLSPEATINTQPQLEIFADDVRCTHGAAVGALDDEALFYLQSRGIDKNSARGLLTYAFANEVIEKIKVEALRERLERMLMTRFKPGEMLETRP
jgi:Fe-S cluster assembly protein SufD